MDTSLLQTAINRAASATTLDEQTEAREAWRLADHLAKDTRIPTKRYG